VAPEDIGLAVPRVILAVPRLALWLVFWPFREGIEQAEKHKLPEKVIDVLYNDERTAAVVPTLSFLSSFGPTVGVRAFHDNLGGHGEKGSISAMAGGLYALAGQIEFEADRLAGSRVWIESRVLYERRPKMVFQGIGDEDEPARSPGDPRATHERTRFSENRFLALQRLGYTIGEEDKVKIGGLGIFNHRTFGPKAAGGDASIESVYDTRQLPGYTNGSMTLELDASVVVDTRDTAGLTSSGAYVEAFAGGVPRLGEFGYVHEGLAASGFFNLYRKTRVLVVRGVIEGVEGPTERIPFDELPRLGGPQRLRGYRLDQFRDEKAATATIEYLYPIHDNIAGALFVDAGRVAHSYDTLFSNLREVRLGVGGGLLFHTADKAAFSLDIAYGDSINIFFTSNPLRAFYQRERQL
jgi:outer membrane protein assembly factor BamA